MSLKGYPLAELPDCSLGEYVWPKLRSHPRDLVLMVNGETGQFRTCGQFLTNAIRLLAGLRKLGLAEKDIVGLLCRNSFEANEILLASWLGAAAVAPINGHMTVAELKHIFALVKPSFIFCEEKMVENVVSALKILSMKPIIVIVDKDKDCPHSCRSYGELLEKEVDVDNFEAHPVKCPADKIIVIPPSSGTSGLPKGIGITHRNLIFQDKVMSESTLFRRGSVLQLSQFFWVTGILMFLRSLTMGTKRIFIKNVTNENILRAIERFKPDYSILAPLSLQALTKHPKFHDHDLSSIKFLITGGSPMTESILKSIREEWPKVKIVNVYGLTECSGIISENAEDDLSIGKISFGTEVKIIDTKTGETLKANNLGEICVKNLGIMNCYVGNEKETKEAIDEDGWLHTGDIGYHDDSGKLYYVDRIKEMIKVRDMQVAPVEIENVIGAIPGVDEVGVAGLPHEKDIFHLIALVVKNKNVDVTEEDISSCVEKTLSEYKRLTGGVRFVESIPKNESGKINRSLLRSMAQRYSSK